VAGKDEILTDPDIDLILISSIPRDRAELAIAAMEAGKDVMVDKPGCTTMEQLNVIRETVARTGRIWTIDFSERFEVPAVTRAAELVAWCRPWALARTG
jgi:predicted dehydrogenase